MYLEKGCVKAALCIDRKYAFQLDKSSPSSETSKRVFLHKLYVNKTKHDHNIENIIWVSLKWKNMILIPDLEI